MIKPDQSELLGTLRAALMRQAPQVAAHVCAPNGEQHTPGPGWYLRVVSPKQATRRIVIDEQCFRWADPHLKTERHLGRIDEVEQVAYAVACAMGANPAPITQADTGSAASDFTRAIHVVSGAFQEAMRRYGLLPSTISAITHEAEELVFKTLTATDAGEATSPQQLWRGITSGHP